MPNYKRMYTTLWRGITAAVDCLYDGNSTAALRLLRHAQQTTEDMYIEYESGCIDFPKVKVDKRSV